MTSIFRGIFNIQITHENIFRRVKTLSYLRNNIMQDNYTILPTATSLKGTFKLISSGNGFASLLTVLTSNQLLRVISETNSTLALTKRNAIPLPQMQYHAYWCIQPNAPWLESASEVYLPSGRWLSVKLVLTFTDRGMSRSQRGGSPTAVFSVF
jgi:hypothetical protein